MENRIRELGNKILQSSRGESGIFKKDFWTSKVLDLTMKDKNFKTSLFRFVDVLPVLNTDEAVVRHLMEYFHDNGLPSVDLKSSFFKSAVSKLVQGNAEAMSKIFILGSDPQTAFPSLQDLRKQRLTFTVDLLGEASVNEEEALIQQVSYLRLVSELPKKAQNWTTDELLDCNHAGPIPKVNISVKLSSLYSQINTADFENTKKFLIERLRPILHAAKERGVFVNLDMEQFALKDLTHSVFKSVLEEPEFQGWKEVGIVVQAYLKSAEADLQDLLAWCQKHNRQITIRLVKGAYWDYEIIQAGANGWEVPVFMQKAQTDANYEKLSRFILDHSKYLNPAFGSHNVRSLAQAFAYAEKLGLPKSLLEVQMLYGMAQPIKRTLINMGYRCRDYAPIGELIPGMAYFVRRLLENTANESFLRLKFTNAASAKQLLQNPESLIKSAKPEEVKKAFVNEAITDFGLQVNRELIEKALEEVKTRLGEEISVELDTKKLTLSENPVQSINPSNHAQVVAVCTACNQEQVLRAVQIANSAKLTWAKTPVAERAQILRRAAEIMRQRRFELIAWEVCETAKPWREADADIAEAIDFCEYYALEAEELFLGRSILKIAGEDNQYLYRSKGVGVVISPWNFPFAIPAGMVSAALVTGNPVLFKPASQSIKMGALLAEIFWEAGCPKDVLQFVPGHGPEIGPVLVTAPETSFIAFTGSMEVGTNIIRTAASQNTGLVKRVIAEMGGKNALIIDEDADLDEALLGTLHSAFGYAGQKCSALSRLIVHRTIYERFMTRLRSAITQLKVGPASDPGTQVPPVIDEKSYKKLLAVIDETKKIAGSYSQASVTTTEGFYVPPTLFEFVPLDATVATQELFGPVIATFEVASIEEAVQLANSVPFALTGGVYSRSPKNIEYVKNHLEVGNLYINRGITGAIVARHPFGGYKLSGVGSKAGGPDYLLQFVDPVTIVENSVRKGFSPDL